MIEFCIVTNYQEQAFSFEVNRLLSEGWELGDFSITSNAGSVCMAQTMWRENGATPAIPSYSVTYAGVSETAEDTSDIDTATRTMHDKGVTFTVPDTYAVTPALAAGAELKRRGRKPKA